MFEFMSHGFIKKEEESKHSITKKGFHNKIHRKNRKWRKNEKYYDYRLLLGRIGATMPACIGLI